MSQHARDQGPGTPNRCYRLLRRLGPGLVTGAANDDPSAIATFSEAGARLGDNLLFPLFLAYPLLVTIQFVSARVGRVTGTGLAGTLTMLLPRPVTVTLVLLLFGANAVTAGADLAAMGQAAALCAGGGRYLFATVFAALSLALQFYIPYRLYARGLKSLTLVLFSYVAVLFCVRIDWLRTAEHALWPGLGTQGVMSLTAAVLGAAISPYLYFWQSGQEAEEIESSEHRVPLMKASLRAPIAFERIRIDTVVGMGFSILIGVAIMISASVTLHAAGQTHIRSAADAAAALRPFAGRFASYVFCLGIIGSGFLAIPVLAGSAARALAETMNWRAGLSLEPRDAPAYYGAILAVVILGSGVTFAGVEPITALVWSATINGIIAFPLLVCLMLVSRSRRIMGEFRIGRLLLGLGWTAALTMALAGGSALWTIVRGTP